MAFKKIKEAESVYQDYFESEYNTKISELIDEINNLEYNLEWPEDKKDYYLWRTKLAKIFQYFTSNCEIDYDYQEPENRAPNKLSYSISYEYNGIPKEHSLAQSVTKYGPILCGKGVCKGFSMAFIDIAAKIGIRCELVEGVHNSYGHGWVVVNDPIDGLTKHIDVYSGITKKGTVNQWDYFMLTTEELLELPNDNYSNFEESLQVAKNRLSGFNPISRTDGQRSKNR